VFAPGEVPTGAEVPAGVAAGLAPGWLLTVGGANAVFGLAALAIGAAGTFFFGAI